MSLPELRSRPEPLDPAAEAASTRPRAHAAEGAGSVVGARLVDSHTLADRYAELAEHPFERRGVDAAIRVLDIAFAGTMLVVFAPALGALAGLVALTSGRPVLYRGPRVGRAGRIFTMYKLRTLRPDAEERIGHLQDVALDAHTAAEHTRVGRLLRATQLDELPQLYNVLRGDMSIVGPRPIRPIFFEQLSTEIPQYWQRLVARPGMTGFAQLRMRREMTWSEKLAHDLEYLADRSVPLYLRMIAATAARICVRVAREVPAALTGRSGAAA